MTTRSVVKAMSPALPKLAIGLLVLLISQLALAKLIPIKLIELVQESSLIAYGRSVTEQTRASSGKTAVTWFEPVSILKGKPLASGKRIAICDSSKDDAESFNLTKTSSSYFIFAKQSDQCYDPVRAMFSVVFVKDDIAETGRISGEPETQPLSGFVKKINFLLAGK